METVSIAEEEIAVEIIIVAIMGTIAIMKTPAVMKTLVIVIKCFKNFKTRAKMAAKMEIAIVAAKLFKKVSIANLNKREKNI